MVTEFGRRLRIIRVNNNDSLRTMAKKLGYSPAHLSSMENGKRAIPIDIADRIKSCYALSDSETEKLMQSILSPERKKSGNLTDFAEQKDRIGLSAASDLPIKEERETRVSSAPFLFGVGNIPVYGSREERTRTPLLLIGVNGTYTLTPDGRLSPRRAKKIRRESAQLIRSVCTGLIKDYAKLYPKSSWNEADRAFLEKELLERIREHKKWEKLGVKVETLTIDGFCLRDGLEPKPVSISRAGGRRFLTIAGLSTLAVILAVGTVLMTPKKNPHLQMVWHDEVIDYGFGATSCFAIDLLADGKPIRDMRNVSIKVGNGTLGTVYKLTSGQLLFLPKAEGDTPVEIRYRGTTLSRRWVCHEPHSDTDGVSTSLSLWSETEELMDAVVFHDSITLSLRYEGELVEDTENICCYLEDETSGTAVVNDDGSITIRSHEEGQTWLTVIYRDDALTRVVFSNLYQK